MQWIRTAEPEIIKQVWIQAVEQKDLFWNNVHKFSPKIQTEHLWRHVFWCVRARCAQRQGRPFLWRWHWHGWGRRAQTRGPHGYDSHWFCWLLLALVSCSLQKPIMNMFFCLQKGCDCPKWPWNATRGSTVVVSENFGGITKWRSWWSWGHGDDDMAESSFQAKDVQTCDKCASSRSLFQTQYGSHGRELAEKQFYTKKVTAQYAFEESCNLGILILDHSCHSCHSCHS